MVRLQFASLALALAWISPAPSSAADGETSSVPNFSSTEFPWFNIGGLRDPATGPGPISYDKAHPIMTREPNNAGDVVERPMTLANLNNPILKPWVIERLRKANEETLAGKPSYGARAACMPAGLPGFLTYGGGFQGLYIIQTPKEVLLINHGDSQIRHIYLDVPHSAHPALSWYGESVGHYDGDELVVDTVGLNDKTFLEDAYGLPHTTELHVVERFKLVQDGNMLRVDFTIDDPSAFNSQWGGTVMYRHPRQPAELAEEPCQDVNVTHGGSFFPPGTGTDWGFPAPVATRADF